MIPTTSTNKILGHERQIAYLDRVRERGTLAHAYLFHGPEQVGKRAVAVEWIKTLFCQNGKKKISDPCSGCASCRQIEDGTHRNVMRLSLEQTLVSKKEERKDIPIDDIREVIRLLSYAPAAGEWRVVLIDQAERMNDEASNAFLKLLEEPGEQTLIILIAPSAELVLSTIASRSQQIAFSLAPDSVLENALAQKKINPEVRKTLLALAGGRPGVLVKFLADPDRLAREQKLFEETLAVVERGSVPEVFDLVGRIVPDEHRRVQCMRYVFGLLRHGLAASAATGTNTPAIINRIKKTDRIATLMQTTNVNPRLALDVFFLTAKGLV